MKNYEEITAQVGELTPEEMERLKMVINLITSLIKAKKINENGLQDLLNISSEINTFVELYFRRIIAGLKQNHMI